MRALMHRLLAAAVILGLSLPLIACIDDADARIRRHLVSAGAGGGGCGSPVSATSLTGGASDTDGTSFSTASVSPTGDRLVLLAVELSLISSAADVTEPTISGNGLTWVAVASVLHWPDATNWFSKLYVFRAMGASPSTGAISITTTETMDSVAWSVAEFANVDTGGTNGSAAVVQSATNAAAATNTVTATLAAFATTDNATYGAFGGGEGSTPPAWTAGTGFTEINEGNASLYASAMSQFRNDNDTTVDATSDIASSDALGAVALELKCGT